MCFNICQNIWYVLSGCSTPRVKHLHYRPGSNQPVPGNSEGKKSSTLSAKSSSTWARLLIISYDDGPPGKPSWKASGLPRNSEVKTSGVPWHLHKCRWLLLSPLYAQLNQCCYGLKPHLGHLEYFSAMHHTLCCLMWDKLSDGLPLFTLICLHFGHVCCGRQQGFFLSGHFQFSCIRDKMSVAYYFWKKLLIWWE